MTAFILLGAATRDADLTITLSNGATVKIEGYPLETLESIFPIRWVPTILSRTSSPAPISTTTALCRAASDEARAAAMGWQRFADAFAAANAGGAASLGQFVGLGVAGGLPGLEAFKGLNDGFAKL